MSTEATKAAARKEVLGTLTQSLEEAVKVSREAKDNEYVIVCQECPLMYEEKPSTHFYHVHPRTVNIARATVFYDPGYAGRLAKATRNGNSVTAEVFKRREYAEKDAAAIREMIAAIPAH